MHVRNRILPFLAAGLWALSTPALIVSRAQTAPAPAAPSPFLVSHLDPAKRNPGQVLRFDIDGDGKPEILETWWHGHRARWIDENKNMQWTDLRGDMVGDCLQVDRDDDGTYDGPHDLTVKWADEDGDGQADLQVIVQHPGPETATLKSHPLYMVFFDVGHDGVNGYINWNTFEFEGWHMSSPANFSSHYNGNSLFIKTHRAPEDFRDPRMGWENPFAFYDYDGDGCTEMAIRVTDEKGYNAASDGHAENVFVTYDLDNGSQHGNEMDYDMSLRFSSEFGGDKLDYSKMLQKHPGLRAPAWAMPYFRVSNWRKIDGLCYIPHDELPTQVFRPKYGSCWLVFDEDKDCHRWERVEFYFPYDPYQTAMWKKPRIPGVQDPSPPSMSGHPQADSLGDRGEFDTDFSGGGKLYVGPDQKIHLYGAEWGAWTVDPGAKYNGGVQNGGASSNRRPEKVGEVVQYRDTDNDGYFDEITYDYDGDKRVDLKISLLDYATPANPHPDRAPLIDPGKAGWQGLHAVFGRIARESFRDALVVYRAAWRAGLADAELDQLAIASSAWEKYDHGYWLKEKIFRRADQRLHSHPEEQKLLRRYYFTGDFKNMAALLPQLPHE